MINLPGKRDINKLNRKNSNEYWNGFKGNLKLTDTGKLKLPLSILDRFSNRYDYSRVKYFSKNQKFISSIIDDQLYNKLWLI